MRRSAVCLLLACFGLAAPLPLLAQTAPSAGKPAPKPAPKPAHPRAPKKDPKKDEPAKEFSVEVMVLHATNSKKGIDARIPNKEDLKKPPFSSYDTYELIEKLRLPLKKNDPKTMRLPNGRVLQTRLIEVLPRDHVRFSASITEPRGKEFLPLLEVKAQLEKPFVVAGQSYKNGMLALVLRVVK